MPAIQANRTSTQANRTSIQAQPQAEQDNLQQMVTTSIAEVESRLMSEIRELLADRRDHSTSQANDETPPSTNPTHNPPRAAGSIAGDNMSDASGSIPPTPHNDTQAPQAASQNPPTLPPITSKLKQKIIRGEYVEFDTLLRENMFPVTGTAEVPSANTQTLTLNLSANAGSSEPQLTLSQAKNPKQRQIQDLQAWMEAWNLYVLVTVAHYLRGHWK